MGLSRQRSRKICAGLLAACLPLAGISPALAQLAEPAPPVTGALELALPALGLQSETSLPMPLPTPIEFLGPTESRLLPSSVGVARDGGKRAARTPGATALLRRAAQLRQTEGRPAGPAPSDPLRAAFDGQRMTTAEAADPDLYLANLQEYGRGLYRKFFPEFHRDFPLRTAYASAAFHDEGGYHIYDPIAGHSIILEAALPVTYGIQTTEVELLFRQAKSAYVQRKIQTLAIFLHEYAHALFDEFVISDQGYTRQEAEDLTYSTMTEGFAVTMELLLMDKLIAAREELGLNDRDVADLRTWKKVRLSALKSARDHYTQGTFYFWRKIYKREGEPGLKKFLAALEVLQFKPFKRRGLLIHQLTQDNPELFKADLARNGDRTLRRGLDLLALHSLYDYPLEGKEKELAEKALDKVSASALRRLFGVRFCVNGGLHGWEVLSLAGKGLSSDPFTPCFALAKLSARVAQELAAFLLYRAGTPKNLGNMLSFNPAKAQKLLDGADGLPLTSQQREVWLSGLATWAAATAHDPEAQSTRRLVLEHLSQTRRLEPALR